jgi:hypothetical protein
MLEVPCLSPEWPPLWIFLVLGILAHARGVVLLVREVRLWWSRRGRSNKTPK